MLTKLSYYQPKNFQQQVKRFFNREKLYSQFLPLFSLIMTVLISIVMAFVSVKISPFVALGGVIAIPFGLMLVLRPVWGIFLVIFFIPFESLNTAGSGSILKILSLAVFGIIAVHYFTFRTKDELVSTPLNWLITLLIFFVLISNFVAIDPSRTLSKTSRLLRIIVLYFFVINVIQSKKNLSVLIWLFIISGILSALYGLYAYYIDPSLLNNHHTVSRMVGTMEDPNEFAGAMVVRLMCALSLLNLPQKNWTRICIIVMVGIFVYSIVLTGSRGGLVGMGAAFLIFVALQKNKTVWFTILFVAMILGLIFMPLSIKQRIGLVESTENLGNDTTRRESYLTFGWGELVQKYPIFGVGFDGFAEAYSRSEFRFLQKTRVKRLAHNTYLEFAAGTGLGGLAIFLSVIGFSIFTSWQAAQYTDQYPYLGNMGIAILTAHVGFFLIAFFISQQYEKTLWLLFALSVTNWNILKNLENSRLLGKKIKYTI